MALPTALTSFAWPSDGIAYVGPFISSAGKVYVVGQTQQGANWYFTIWKATDPTVGFTTQYEIGWLAAGAVATSWTSFQYGDILWFIGPSSYLYSFNMANDTIGTSSSNGVFPGVTVNGGVSAARRSNGDVIVAINYAGVVNMGKTYGRVAARRVTGGTTFDATPTAIGIGLAATTLQSESVDAAILGSSDRIHLFWTQTSFSAGAASTLYQRTVKSTDNLNGTSPATAAQTGSGTLLNIAPDDVMHTTNQVFCSAAGVLAIPVAYSSSVLLGLITATSADTLVFSSNSQVNSGPSPIMTAAVGLTDRCARCGGMPIDGTDIYAVWIDNASGDPMYRKNTAGSWGTITTIQTGVTSSQISANIFQRGSNIVLAMIYDTAPGTWVYNEIVLRTSGPPAQSVVLPTAVATLTGGTLDITEGGVSLALPTAVVTLVGGAVSVLVPPITVSLPTATVQLTAGVVSVSAAVSLALPPATVSLTAGTITSVTGAVSVTLPTAVTTLTAGVVSRTAGSVLIPLGTAITTLIPGILGVVTAAPPITVALPTAVVNLSAGTIGISSGPVSRALGTAVATLTAGAFSVISGPVSRAITPANVILSAGVLSVSSSISVPLGTASVTVTPGVLGISPGATSVALSPAIVVLSAGTISRSAMVSLPLSPAVITLTAGTISRTTGGISVPLSPAIVTLTGGSLNITAQGGPQSRALGTAIAILSPGVLSVSTGGVTRPLGTAQVVLTAGVISRTAQVNRAIEAAAVTLAPGTLGIISTKSVSLEPAITTLMPGILDIKIVFGGLPKVWNGVAWVTKPVKVWNGSAWVEKPMKVWNGSSWELA